MSSSAVSTVITVPRRESMQVDLEVNPAVRFQRLILNRINAISDRVDECVQVREILIAAQGQQNARNAALEKAMIQRHIAGFEEFRDVMGAQLEEERENRLEDAEAQKAESERRIQEAERIAFEALELSLAADERSKEFIETQAAAHTQAVAQMNQLMQDQEQRSQAEAANIRQTSTAQVSMASDRIASLQRNHQAASASITQCLEIEKRSHSQTQGELRTEQTKTAKQQTQLDQQQATISQLSARCGAMENQLNQDSGGDCVIC